MTNSTLSTLDAVRIITANLGPRYKGRTALVRAAERGDAVALELLDATPGARRLAAITGRIAGELAIALGFGEQIAQIAKLRATRKANQTIKDPILSRQPGNVARRATLRAFHAALKVAGFRQATHDHTLRVEFVEVGHEYASSSTGTLRSEDAGLGKAYCRQAWFVTTSTHRFGVSVAFFQSATRAKSGQLQLTPAIKVKQSRGTALRVERKQAAATLETAVAAIVATLQGAARCAAREQRGIMITYAELTYTVPATHRDDQIEIAYAVTPDELVRRTSGVREGTVYETVDLCEVSGQIDLANRRPSVPHDAWEWVDASDRTPA